MEFTDLIGLDFETYGALPLPAVGLVRYVNDKTFVPTLASVATQTGTVTLEFPAEQPDRLHDLLIGSPVCAHNAGFERAVLATMGIDIPICDSAVVAAVAGADRHLAGAARQLLNMNKLDDDRSLMHLFAIPQKDQLSPEFDRDLVTAHADKWAQYKEYCERDAMLSRKLIVDWHGDESLFTRELMYTDITLAMNEAGWPVDMAAVDRMRELYLENMVKIQHDFARDVDADLNIFSHVQVKKWCADRGVKSSSFDKQHVETLIRRLDRLTLKGQLTPGQQQVLDLLFVKQALGGSSLKKLEVIAATEYKGRVYDQYLHAGAPQSLRTSGRSIQMQNLPRLASVLRDVDELHDAASIWSNEHLSGNLRQVFRSSHPQGALIVADFVSIESRALGYLAGETWKVEAYRAGHDIYKAQAVKIFRLRTTGDVTKDQRLIGKVGELSCGYGAGAVAVKDFAAKMHVDLSESEAAKLVRDWRDANPATVQFWEQLGNGLIKAVTHRTSVMVQAANGIKISFVPGSTPASLLIQEADAQSVHMNVWKDGCKLMSRVFHGCYLRGHNVGYYKPSTLKGGKPWKRTYVDPKTKRSKFYELYGGKLAGILTQSLCREIFFESLALIDIALNGVDNATIIGQFHDEVVVDWVPGDTPAYKVVDILTRAMSLSTAYPELPMDVEVKSDYRYTK
jgi:DNA polymerase bacteriophage-type